MDPENILPLTGIVQDPPIRCRDPLPDAADVEVRDRCEFACIRVKLEARF